MPKVVETTHCEKHPQMPAFVMEDGTTKHTCSVCHPEIVEKPEMTHKRLTTFSSVGGEGWCDEFTLNHVLKTMKVYFEVPDHASVDMFNDCVDCGHDFDYGKNVVKNVPVNVHPTPKDVDKRWYSTTVTFDCVPNLRFHDVNVHTVGNKLSVTNNEFTGHVLRNL